MDAWALLAFIQGEEPAASRVVHLLEDAQNHTIRLYLSLINLGEVFYRIGWVKGETEADETLEELRGLPVTILPAGEEAVLSAARIKMAHPVSYADAFAAAETARLNATLVTGDPELIQLAGVIRIERLQRNR
jgi:predicted nucleic acid-binding protein